MDIATSIEYIYPAAQYYGSLTGNDKASFDNLNWIDEREKPTWNQIKQADKDRQLPNIDKLKEQLNSERDSLLSLASLRVAPLQDAVDLGTATDSELESLKQWKSYRVEVNRVSQQEGYPLEVIWPVQPN